MEPVYLKPTGQKWWQGTIRDGELTIVLQTDPTEASLYDDLSEYCDPHREIHHEHLIIKAGSFEPHGSKPFLLAKWNRPDRPFLERRWLVSKLIDITRTYSTKSLLIYSPNWSGEDRILARDVINANNTPLQTGSELESVRMIGHADPSFAIETEFSTIYRQWINENPDTLTSIEIGRRLKDFAGKHGCEFETLDAAMLKDEGMNLLLAVGQASSRSPGRLHLVTHTPQNTNPPILLVGKGITFDTGGINVKHHDHFVNCMKNDMGGAALMSSLFMGLVNAGFDYPLALAIPCCENLVSEKAMKPGSILRSYKGKSVFIEHTDCEGRLILADALAYAEDRYKPSLTISAATLTTASLRQFTSFFTPVHFAPTPFRQALDQVGRETGEGFRFWDYFAPFKAANFSKAADLTNMGMMPGAGQIGGGSNVAAHFLKEFVEGRYVHFDIFNTTWNWGGDYPGASYGATGAPFASMFRLMRDHLSAVLTTED